MMGSMSDKVGVSGVRGPGIYDENGNVITGPHPRVKEGPFPTGPCMGYEDLGWPVPPRGYEWAPCRLDGSEHIRGCSGEGNFVPAVNIAFLKVSPPPAPAPPPPTFEQSLKEMIREVVSEEIAEQMRVLRFSLRHALDDDPDSYED
jgi:hypothetical protein